MNIIQMDAFGDFIYDISKFRRYEDLIFLTVVDMEMDITNLE